MSTETEKEKIFTYKKKKKKSKSSLRMFLTLGLYLTEFGAWSLYYLCSLGADSGQVIALTHLTETN